MASGKQEWLARKSPTHGGLKGNIIYKWVISYTVKIMSVSECFWYISQSSQT